MTTSGSVIIGMALRVVAQVCWRRHKTF